MNIRLATGTPPPTSAELERFRNTFLAPGQGAAARRFSSLAGDVLLLTIGEVLDSRGQGDCTYGRWSYKASSEKFSAWYAPCRSRSCPRCVRPYLEERVAPAWAFWNGSATVARHADGPPHRNWRRRVGFKIQGPDSTIGGLVIPGPDDQLTVLRPGDELRGRELDGVLLRAVRAVPIPLKAPGDPVPWMGTIPRWMSRQEFAGLVRAAGGEGFRLHGRGVGTVPLSQGQKDELMAAIWGRGGRGGYSEWDRNGDTANGTSAETRDQGILSHFP